MLRLFPENAKRAVTILDGLWQFKTDPNDKGIAEGWAQTPPKDTVSMVVPSLWTCAVDTLTYEGVAWYFTEFSVCEQNAYIHFEGVSGQCDVYVDGVRIGGHYGGFTGFGYTLPKGEKGVRRLALRVDSRPNRKNTIPLTFVDWYHHGGISRSVWLQCFPAERIASAHAQYTLDLAAKCADVTLMVAVENAAVDTPLRVLLDGVPVAITACAQGENGVQTLSFSVDNLTLWSPDCPRLYRLDVESPHDGLAEMLGFRTVEVRDKKVCLNGAPLFLQGVNRHEEHPDFGFALPPSIMLRDIRIAKDLGCNTIRMSHYPNSPLFLDMCDKEGILLWEEIPMWGFPPEALADPLTMERGLAMHREMVLRDFNHPSIIFWGLHNEIHSHTPEGRAISEAFSKLLRSLDASRLITFASNRPNEDICFDLVDVISVNRYYGWYHDTYREWAGFLESFYKQLDEAGQGDKAVIMSEFGAGAVAGVHSFEKQRWSEEFQEECLGGTLDIFLADERLAGALIWQYCDIRVCNVLALQRPRGFNNKGIVDEFRRPKMAYRAVKERFVRNLKKD